MKYQLLPDEEAIRRLMHDTEQQFSAGNFDAARRFYAQDAVLMMPGAPPVRGNAAIQAVLEKVFGAASVKVTLEITAVNFSSGRDMAYVYGTGTADTHKTNWLAVFGRQPDGSWRVVADIFNSAG